MEIEIGNGDYEIVPIDLNGRKGLLFRYDGEKHEIGEKLNDAGDEYQIKETDVVIWFENIEGARVVQDAMNMSVLNMLYLNII